IALLSSFGRDEHRQAIVGGLNVRHTQLAKLRLPGPGIQTQQGNPVASRTACRWVLGKLIGAKQWRVEQLAQVFRTPWLACCCLADLDAVALPWVLMQPAQAA